MRKTDTNTSVPKVPKPAPKSMPTMPTPPPAPITQEPESFIIQNIQGGPLYISDMRLTLDPFEIHYLTYEKPEVIYGSQDLRKALRAGFVIRITQEEADALTDKQLAAQRAKAVKEQRQRQRELVEVDDRQVDAEVLDLNSAEHRTDEVVTTAGMPNDPLTYATAYAAAAEEAARRGETLDAAEFYEMVQENPNLVGNYLSGSKNRGVTSGTTKRGRATVAMPPVNEGQGTQTSSFNMSNFNRDHTLAGADNMTVAPNFVEEINLADED